MRTQSIARLMAAVVVLVVACGPPVSVRRVSPRVVPAELNRSALNSNRPSLFSENVLYRWNLAKRFKRDPEAALAELRDKVVSGQASTNGVFALAELSFLHADKTGQREYYLAAVVYSYAFLFPSAVDAPPDAFDPRTRTAADLYNRGLTEAFASRRHGRVDLRSGMYPLPGGQQLAVRLDEQSLVWANRQVYDFVPVAELKVSGLGARYRRPGIGAPLAASMRPLGDDPRSNDFVATQMKVPVTALLRIDDPRRQLGAPVVDGSLMVYNDYDARGTEVDGRQVPLESEPSAAMAYSLSRSTVWGWELWGFLLGDLLGQEKITKPIAFVEPYRRGRIPVVFVHGTASSPGRWADMLNVLSNNRNLHDRFQYWFFFYETGNPIPYSAMRLRETLTEVVHKLDPGGTDAALKQMVVIGHSQGGLLTKMTAIDSGNRFWGDISRRPLDDLDVSADTRDLLRRTFFIEPLPFVRELIFISTPHQGSYVAAYSMAHLVARFARLPLTLLGATGELLQGNRDAILFDPERPALGAVYGMTPGSPFIKALAATPIDPGVEAHSIIPVLGDLPPEGQADGVVKYDSAHIAGVASELVVPRQGHSAQANPVAIEEVRRILVEHADRVCKASRVACGDGAPGNRVIAIPTPDGR